MNPSLKGFRYSIVAKIEKIKLSINFPCELIVNWRVGHQKIETKNKISHNPSKSLETIINEELLMQTLILYNQDRDSFIQKKSRFSIIILTSKGKKMAGVVNNDLSEYLNRKISNVNEEFNMEKCPAKIGKLKLSLAIELIGESEEKEILNQSTISSRMSDPFSLVDESFRTLSNDITFSMESTFIKSEPILKEFNGNRSLSNTLKEKENKIPHNFLTNNNNNNDIVANSLINTYENFKNLNHYTSEILSLKKRLNEKTDENQKLLITIEEIKRIKNERSEKLKEMEKLFENMQSTNTDLKEEIANLKRNQEGEMKKLNDCLKNKNFELEKKKEIITNIKEQCAAEYRKVLEENLEIKNSNQQLEAKLLTIENEKFLLEMKVKSKEEETQKNFEELSSKTNQKIDYYEKNFKDFLSKLELAQSEIDIAKKENLKIIEEKKGLSNKIQELNKFLSESQTKLETQEKNNNSFKSEISRLTNELNTYIQKEKNYKVDLENYKKNLVEFDSKYIQLKDEKKDHKVEMSKLREENLLLLERKNSFFSELEHNKMKIMEMEAKIQKLEKEKIELNLEIKKLTTQKSSMASDLSILNHKMKLFENEKNESSIEVDKLHNEKNSIIQKSESFHVEIQELKKEIEKLKSEKIQLVEKINDQVEKNGRLENELGVIEQKIEIEKQFYKDEVSKIKEKFGKGEKEKNCLVKEVEQLKLSEKKLNEEILFYKSYQMENEKKLQMIEEILNELENKQCCRATNKNEKSILKKEIMELYDFSDSAKKDFTKKINLFVEKQEKIADFLTQF